jgi:hypothetical protein
MNASTLAASRPDHSLTATDRTARLLGWFSLGLGLAEIVAPGRIAKALGLEGQETLLRAYGGREIVAGVGALSIDPTPAIWSRVAGDLVDLGTLAVGLRGNDDEQQRKNAVVAIAAVAGITLLDLFVANSLRKERKRERGETRDFSDRSGFPAGAAQARGAASDFETPADYRAAPALADVSQS